jgi:hypothetical protein
VVGEATRSEVADLIEATKVREFRTLGIVLGMRYVDSPIIARRRQRAAGGAFYAVRTVGASWMSGASSLAG